MLQQADSLTIETESSAQPAVHIRTAGQSPAAIIGRLPQTATPWQQDSILRANYKYQQIDWSKHPEEHLGPLTGMDGAKMPVLSPTMTYSPSLVCPDSLYNPLAVTPRPGVAGDPVPYTIAGDSLITSILLACFILAAVAIVRSAKFIGRQLKDLFYTPRSGSSGITETGSELRFQFFLMLQTCLLFALITFFYMGVDTAEGLSLNRYQIIGTLTGLFAAYFGVKLLLYGAIGWVFFEKKKNLQWAMSLIFLSAIEGIVLFPAVLLLAYFRFSIHGVFIYAIVTVVIVKLLEFYRSNAIFFKGSRFILQSFLYFCTLEIMPFGMLWGVLSLFGNFLRTNY